MRTIEAIFKGLDVCAGWLVSIAMLLITTALFTNSIARYFAGFTLIGSEELARYLVVWLTFVGGYLLVRQQRQICVDVVLRLSSGRVLTCLDVLVGVVGALIMGYVAWLGWELALFIWNTGQMSSSLPIRRAWIYLAIPVGCGLMALAYGLQVILRCTGRTGPPPMLPSDSELLLSEDGAVNAAIAPTETSCSSGSPR